MPGIDEHNIVFATRRDVVGTYVGETTSKTHQFLTSNIGKIIAFKEPLVLADSELDPFGHEALSILIYAKKYGISVVFSEI